MAILKNTTVLTGGNAAGLQLPVGTTAQRPTTPTSGDMRYNSTIGVVEVYVNGVWIDAANGVPVGGMLVELWGAGGGGSGAGGWAYGAAGGAGGFTWGYLVGLTPGESLVLVVGQGGQNYGTTSSFGGGAPSSTNGVDNRYGAGGGGLSGIFRGSYTFANALMIAGGGGGGGCSRAGSGNVGGAGGGYVGQPGTSAYDSKPAYAGLGGTQTAAGANATSDSANAGGQQGQLQGGSSRTNSYGGGGGGGYYGGSGGGYSEQNTMAGGGGGSGYVHPTYVSQGYTIWGNGQTPPGVPAPPSSYGTGSAGINTANSGGNAGAHGYARITKNGTTTTYTYTGSNISLTF